MISALWLSMALLLALALSVLLFAVTAASGRGLLSGRRHLTVPLDDRVPQLLAEGLLPLSDCPRGHTACLRCLHVDRCVVHRLLELGLTPGVELRVVQDSGGPMLVSVRGSRVALGRDLAANLWVEVESPGNR